MKTSREFKLTEFEQPTKIRWTELTKNAITAPDGGCHGFGKLILPIALRGAKKDADAFAGRIKAAAEAS